MEPQHLRPREISTNQANRLLLVAHGHPVYGDQVCQQFRRLGWEVHSAKSGSEVRRLARLLTPAAVVLSTELPEESGWLTCAKLAGEQPGLKVTLVSVESSPEKGRLTSFVGGAALVGEVDGIPALVKGVYGTMGLAAAN